MCRDTTTYVCKLRRTQNYCNFFCSPAAEQVMTLVDTETQRRELLFVRAGFRVGFDGGLLLGVKHVGDEKEHQSFFKHGVILSGDRGEHTKLGKGCQATKSGIAEIVSFNR